jgi:hypothetical protein
VHISVQNRLDSDHLSTHTRVKTNTIIVVPTGLCTCEALFGALIEYRMLKGIQEYKREEVMKD